MKSFANNAMLKGIMICIMALPVGLKAAESAGWKGDFDANAPTAAAGLVKRLLPKHSDRFSFEVIAPDNGRDVFDACIVYNELRKND